MRGEENRTTVMIRNIPNKFKQMTLLELINRDYIRKYDYFYLPMDLKVKYISKIIIYLDLMQCWLCFYKFYPSCLYFEFLFRFLEY
jgi:hypothetical protein